MVPALTAMKKIDGRNYRLHFSVISGTRWGGVSAKKAALVEAMKTRKRNYLARVVLCKIEHGPDTGKKTWAVYVQRKKGWY